MKEFVLPLLVLSHAYVVPQLKRICEQPLEHVLLTLETVVDVLQLSLLCDAPRLILIGHRMILRNFKAVSSTEGWEAMKKSHPALEKEIVETVIDEENVRDFFVRLFPLVISTLILNSKVNVKCNFSRYKRRKSEKRMSRRSIFNYVKQWRLLFTFAEMVAGQLVHMIRISKRTRHLANMEPAKG